MDKIGGDPVSGYLFVHLGCPAVKDEEFVKLHQAGFKVLILDDVGIKPKSQCYFEYDKVDFSDPDEILKIINAALNRTQLKLGSVFTLADGSVDFTNLILKRLNRNPIHHSSVESIRNKFAMRISLEQFGFKLPVCDVVSAGEIPKEYGPDHFPLVVKPVDSMSSRSVRLVNNRNELFEACQLAQTESTEVSADHGSILVEEVYRLKRQALIESYLPGEEFSAEVILLNRQVLFLSVTSKITSGGPYFVEKGHIAGRFRDDPVFETRVRDLINAVIQAGQFDTTVLHIEFKESDNGTLNLIECNARMGGDQICALTEQATGCNILITYLKLNMGLLQPKPVAIHTNVIALRYFITAPIPGTLTSRTASFKRRTIIWWYGLGERVRLLGSERAIRIGVLESQFSDAETLRTFLSALIAKESELFQIDPGPPNGDDGGGGSGSGIGRLARMKLNSIFLIGTISISLIFAFCVALLLRGYQSQYIKLFGESLSSSIQQYVGFKEILPIAFQVSKADAKGWCKRIVVIDVDNRVLYSTSHTGFSAEGIFSAIDRAGFDFAFPIESNGVTEGYVLIDRGYSRIMAIFAALSILFLALAGAAYFLFVNYLLPMAFLPFEAGVNQLERILSGLAVELDGLGDRKISRSIILSGYRKELDSVPANVREISGLKRKTDQILHSIAKIQSQIDERERLEGLANESKKAQDFNLLIGDAMAQIAHDIRSPLSALQILSSSLDSEDKRILLRAAVRRISDIAQGLSLRRTKQSRFVVNPNELKPMLRLDKEKASVELISSVISEIISEKRLQYHDFPGKLELEFDIENKNYCLFAKIQPAEFKRVLSNLIDNSVEAACDNHQRIIVSLEQDDPFVIVTVRDFGRGIPEEKLESLGDRGNTFGKASGSGLGLYHAKKKILEWDGSLSIESEVGNGTTITIRLPKAHCPKWFLSKLVVPSPGLVSVVDDDDSIHQVWNQRLGQFGLRSAGPNALSGLLHFSDASGFTRSQVYKRPINHLFLIDYELLGDDDTGLDMIEKLHIPGQNCVLVTSHWNEPHIRRRCERLDVKLLPKNLAQHIEIGYY